MYISFNTLITEGHGKRVNSVSHNDDFVPKQQNSHLAQRHFFKKEKQNCLYLFCNDDEY